MLPAEALCQLTTALWLDRAMWGWVARGAVAPLRAAGQLTCFASRWAVKATNWNSPIKLER